ncbi:MAG TPA: tRNA lysidine(34) synthetase TilS [Candidatus Baltobacteraceae bacterium]|nr:tRNA lysidine(34) synthetase TilS [Candidatus Baltobacteraceae bacterium]
MRGTHPERAIEQAVEREGVVRKGDAVLVACSGGSDSIGVAAILHAIQKTMELRLTLAHVNHGVRASAWQDEAVVLRASAALGVPVKIVALQPERRDEATLRDARYDALVKTARECGCSVIATGHNAEDQTETVLLALFRGTGLQGLAGMPARRPLAAGVDLVRPLMRFPRAEIREYVQNAGLPYSIDPTNADPALRRNAVREALTALRPLFPGLDAAVARAAQVVGDELAEAPMAALRRRVRDTLREHDALRGVDFDHIEAAVRALERGGSGRFAMGPGLEVTIENGELTVHREMR